jgi:TP901 family phage tail tape measure protein
VAGAFDAKVDISTKEATSGLQALRKEVVNTGTALTALDKIIGDGKKNINEIVNEFTKLIAIQRTAAAAAKEVAQADIAAARAAGIRNTADAKVEETLARKANQEAQAARATAQSGLAAARTAESETRRGIASDRASQATQRAMQSQLAMNDSLSNSRYLMYDVGATYGVLAAGLLAIPAATAAVAASYQRDFAQVIRVNEDLQGSQNAGAAQALKDSLKTMATDMPIAFDELSRITQLGAQMGVANDKLSQFTDTTAKFVAVTGISADTGATLFGRMETSFTADVQKFPDFFERVGSSIAQVGAATVATDPEIASMLSQIGPLGAAAGMSAANVTGLSAALASVRVQPELARGTLTRVFGQLNRDAAEGGPELEAYGKLLGMTGDQAAKLWKTDSSTFFNKLIAGLNAAQLKNGELTTTFDQLGITASRDVSALTKLAVGNDVLVKSMKEANDGFAEGTALNKMSQITFDTIISKLTEMSNAWKNLGDTLGGKGLAPLASLVDMSKNLAIWIDNLSKNVDGSLTPIGGLIALLMGFATITALFLGFKAAQAFVTAGFIGFQQAAARGVGAGLSLSGTMRQLAVTMLMAKGMTSQAANGFVQASGAMAGYRAGVQRLTVSNNVANSGFAMVTGAAGRMGSSLLGLVGGPIGLVIGALSLLIGNLISTQAEAEQTGKSIATAMQQGAETGARAVAEAFNSRKVNALNDGAIGFTDVDKTVTQIAERAGVSFNKIVDAVAKGETGMKDFKASLEAIAHDQGFKTLDDFLATAAPGNKAADIKFIAKAVDEATASSKEQAKGLAAVEAAAPGATAAIVDTGDGSEETATSIDKMTKALKELNDQVFGTINAESDLQDALAKTGEGLQKSGSFNPSSDAGRTNLKNIEDSLSKARDYYASLKQTNQLTAREAAQGYADFVSQLFAKVRSMGGDTSYIEDMANTTKDKFAAAIGGQEPAKLPVAPPDPGLVKAAAADTRTEMQKWFDANEALAKVGVDSKDADMRLSDLANALVQITGLPYSVVMDALTNPASDKAKEVQALITSITNGTYVAPIGADITAAVGNVQAFSSYARTELANLQNAYNNVLSMSQHANGFLKGAANDALGKGWDGKGAQTYFGPAPSVPVATAPTQQAATSKNSVGLGGVTDGYNKAAEAAKKAGAAGKKAGEDMADGINDAVRAAEDYGNRLKTGLMSAYNQQYNLTKATDDYHTALNAITKKRKDDLDQLEEMRIKVKALNDERDKELITANKAKIEKNISLKYGEADRAADYGNQAKTALDNAAAKQKDIDATNKQSSELAAGIGQLKGFSEAAIANREALRGLETKVIDMVAAYASQGHTTDEVRRYAQKLTGQFQIDVGQMGLNQAAVGNLQGSMQRYIDVVDRVPLVKPTTVTADTGQASGAIDGIQNQLSRAGQGVVVPVTADTGSFDWYFNEMLKRAERNLQVTLGDPAGTGSSIGGRQNGSMMGGAFTGGLAGDVAGFAGGGHIPGTPPSNPNIDNLMAKVDGKGMIRVRSNEFIQSEPAVKYYGLDTMNAINTMKLPKFTLGGSVSGGRGGSGGGGSSIVGLDAETLAFLASLKQEVKLYADAKEIASTVNAGNKQLAAEGRN